MIVGKYAAQVRVFLSYYLRDHDLNIDLIGYFVSRV